MYLTHFLYSTECAHQPDITLSLSTHLFSLSSALSVDILLVGDVLDNVGGSEELLGVLIGNLETCAMENVCG